MYYTGIDLHKKTSFITTVDEEGRVVARRNLPNELSMILGYFDALDQPTQVVIESMGSWYWLYDALSQAGHEVMISNPGKTKAIASAKIKNDKVDSHMLAQLLRAGLIARVHVSRLETRQLKELLRHRSKLVNDARRMKNRIHILLMKNNIQQPFSDLFGARGIEYLRQLPLPPTYQEPLKVYLALYLQLEQQIAPLTRQLQQLAKQQPMAKLLMSIPGVGPLVAMTFVAEVEDIGRFASYRKLSAYAGLVPSLDSSAGKDRRGHITKQGSKYLRTALIESAQCVARLRTCRLNAFFRRRIVRSGYSKAVTATAHKILQIAYYVLKNQQPYQEQYVARA
jgi:transposase